ncbi:ABC transporter ATP-binding protein [Mesorhizobium intechi]|uniref:ABC transporter ATP-binding protein n=1 Tax=Mesorhizobium intechi TaxID=537601 RepID=UPI000CAC8447|nr:ABC transporter ATP-binding protein [Mesorhizobium intechi]TSE13413.1 ABC transporter ATP-binding protein [Mesorhizobium intechi]
MTNAIEIENLRIDLPRSGFRKRVPVINDLNLCIEEGEAVGLVGESGSGKSMTTRAIMHLLPDGAQRSGSVRYRGQEIADFDRRTLALYRSRDLGVIFQDPRAHINPLWTIGDFLVEAVVANRQMLRAEATDRAIALLAQVGISNGSQRIQQYPHQLSGGLLQRVMIVSALMPSPAFILADEISTALDVTVQSEVMAILSELRQSNRLGMLFITHDLDLAAAVTDRLAIMYAGSIVEVGPSHEISTAPKHPYTAALMASRPSLTEVRRLQTVPGRPISAFEAGNGCVFASRCSFAAARCSVERPLARQEKDRSVACHFAADLAPAISVAASQ